jgi:hypothetical protein
MTPIAAVSRHHQMILYWLFDARGQSLNSCDDSLDLTRRYTHVITITGESAVR